MLTRILTSIIGIAVFFGALAAPTGIFPIILFVVTVLMLYEMYSVLNCGWFVNAIGFLSAAAAFEAISYFGSNFGLENESLGLFITLMLFFYLIAVVLKHGKKNCKDILAHGFITLYISVCMSFIARINTEFSPLATLWVFIIAWMSDSGAYFAGVFLGKHKLCPTISPKKTVEGAVGGLLASTLSCGAYYLILIKTGFLGNEINVISLLSFVGMGFFGSMLSQAGDFVASCIKRDYNIKDYGSILPGHGGLMDRFDSVVFIAPFVYYCLYLIGFTLILSLPSF